MNTQYDTKHFFLIIIISILIMPISHAEEAKKIYTVGIVPQYEFSKLHSIWQPILNYLEKETGYQFKLKGSPNIPEFEKEFIQGKFDFAYMNPYHLVVANEIAGYQPLLRDHGRKLYGVLVAMKDSQIKTPADLNGKKIAFPAPNALGASLQIRQELVDKFNIKFTPIYVKTHDNVYMNVLLGKTMAGGGVQKTLTQQVPQFRDALKVIHTTKKVPPHPFAALPSVPVVVKEKVTQALLNFGESLNGKTKLSRIPMKQIGPASIEDYEPIKALGLERYYKQP